MVVTVFDLIALLLHFAGVDALDLKSVALITMTYLVYAATFVPVYVARIYRNSMMRPSYIVDQTEDTTKDQDADDSS